MTESLSDKMIEIPDEDDGIYAGQMAIKEEDVREKVQEMEEEKLKEHCWNKMAMQFYEEAWKEIIYENRWIRFIWIFTGRFDSEVKDRQTELFNKWYKGQEGGIWSHN